MTVVLWEGDSKLFYLFTLSPNCATCERRTAVSSTARESDGAQISQSSRYAIIFMPWDCRGERAAAMQRVTPVGTKRVRTAAL